MRAIVNVSAHFDRDLIALPPRLPLLPFLFEANVLTQPYLRTRDVEDVAIDIPYAVFDIRIGVRLRLDAARFQLAQDGLALVVAAGDGEMVQAVFSRGGDTWIDQSEPDM